MRFMILVHADENSEAGVMPSTEAEGFGEAFTPELREQEERLRAHTPAQD